MPNFKIDNRYIFHNTDKGGGANKYQDDINSDTNSLLGIRALWRAVITQALMDAASSSKKPFYIMQKMKARAWLRGNSKDFQSVCALADMDPQYVKQQAQIAIINNCQWRNSGIK